MLHSECAVGLEVGGYNERPDWPKLGPSLLVAASMILAIRTAKWAARHDERLSNLDLAVEIDYAVSMAGAVLSKLMAKNDAIFPQRKEPWYQATDEDTPK
ncbi:hypothetical protein ACPOL_0806 [Acidisarcina polymorpha]|uniref:Uncharacterized protein n=1 Tax=Acidisarcina polymorpha TaxID=2211140 RepID=A0A2Z5FUI8_9BACT|nr:hypothetical protein [Acidisarcina polymorpha]AXC10167.1 hypothetical protein ACPOL_0806 [Acidisarcina polymorpha]